MGALADSSLAEGLLHSRRNVYGSGNELRNPESSHGIPAYPE